MQVSRLVMLAAVVTTLASPFDLLAQHPQVRDGFWFNVGLGWGSFSCEDCEGRDGGFSGALGLGGKLSQRVLLGGSYNFWTKTEDDVTFTVGTLTAAMRFYPSSRGGFFLLAGLGLGTARLEFLGLEADGNGVGGLLGLGYDIRVGSNVSLTPYWNVFGVNYENGDANVGQLGLGITIH